MSYKTASPDRYGLLKAFARENRKNATLAETVLWEYLRNGELGEKFLRQHIIGDYIADFVCLSHKLIVELDGGYHQLACQQISDAQRTQWLEAMGYRVIRFTNQELFNDINKVLETIEENLYA